MECYRSALALTGDPARQQEITARMAELEAPAPDATKVE
jgi:hypothetical protein